MVRRIGKWLGNLSWQSLLDRFVRFGPLVVRTETAEPVLGGIVPYDENLLERSRSQWQFGKWDNLAKLDREVIQNHPDRAKLALLAASGHMQLGNMAAARRYTRLAQEWGCSRKLMAQLLISGVHNTLGRAAAVDGNQEKTHFHFRAAVACGFPGVDRELVAQARSVGELASLGLSRAKNGLVGSPIDFSRATGLPEPAASVKPEVITSTHNAYYHNREMGEGLCQALIDFAGTVLKRGGIKPSYIYYLAARAGQIERNCSGRLATTIQDAVVRQLVAESVPGDQLCILEIGGLFGVSLAILYNHCITRYKDVKVICLDPLDSYYGKVEDALFNTPISEATFQRNMQLASVPAAGYVLIKHLSTDPVALAMARNHPINLLIVDGDHSYEGVKFDFDTFFPLLEPGGYVIFDDYHEEEPGVQEFIDQELPKAAGVEYLGALSRTAVARKLSRTMP